MCLHYCLTKQWSSRKKRSTQQLIGQLMRSLPGCWEVIGQNPEGNLQVLGRGEGVFQFSSHIKAIKHCVCMGGCTGANFLSGEWGKGNRGRRQEVRRGSCTHCPCATLFLWQQPTGWEVSRDSKGRVPLKQTFSKNAAYESAGSSAGMYKQIML